MEVIKPHGLPWRLSANAGDMSSIPRWRRSPGEGNGNSLQYSCQDKPVDREVRRATVHRVAKESDTTERLNNKQNHIQHRIVEKTKGVECYKKYLLKKKKIAVFGK